MPDYYEPYNSKYCKEIKCPHRYGNKCEIPDCIHPKKIRWWTKYGGGKEAGKIEPAEPIPIDPIGEGGGQ